MTTPVSSPRIAIDVGLVVAHLETSLGFYRDLIGLSVVADVRTSLIGPGRMVQLAHGHALIKLIQFDDQPAHPPSVALSGALGYRYITLMVSDWHDRILALEQHGVGFTVPPTRLETGAAIAMVTDPDGNVVEFVQASP